MIDNFGAIMRAQNLSPFMKRVIFKLGRVVETKVRDDSRFFTVEWLGVRYTDVIPLEAADLNLNETLPQTIARQHHQRHPSAT